MGYKVSHTLFNHGKILCLCVLHDGFNMQVPGLSKYGDHRRMAVYQCLDVGILVAGFFRAPGGTKSSHFGVFEFYIFCQFEKMLGPGV